jgi:hypothetical protein
VFEPDRDGLLMSPIQGLVECGHSGAHKPRMKERKVMFAHFPTCITRATRGRLTLGSDRIVVLMMSRRFSGDRLTASVPHQGGAQLSRLSPVR